MLYFQLRSKDSFTGTWSSRNSAIEKTPRLVPWHSGLFRREFALRRHHFGLSHGCEIFEKIPQHFHVSQGSIFIFSYSLMKKHFAFRVMRYEDLSANPYKSAKRLFEFYGLNFHENVKEFLNTHTKTDVGGVSSTFRNSKVAPFHWRNDLDFEEVEEIQMICKEAMQLWGYNLAANATHQQRFNPLTHYTLDDLWCTRQFTRKFLSGTAISVAADCSQSLSFNALWNVHIF